MRYKILKEERVETLEVRVVLSLMSLTHNQAREQIKKDLASKQVIKQELEKQKKDAMDRLEKLKAELKLIQSFIDKTEEEVIFLIHPPFHHQIISISSGNRVRKEKKRNERKARTY